MKKLQVETLPLTAMRTNCYLAVNTETKELFIVDPSGEPARIKQRVQAIGGKPVAILLTHGHFDHIGAADAIRAEYQIPVYALLQEQEVLEDYEKNLSLILGQGFTVKADYFLRDQQELTLADVKVKVIHTPGHTVGGACYYVPEEDVLFSGDTLFRCSVGRTDFPGGDMGDIHRSIHEKLFVLPDETVVYPGHDSASDIKYEKMFNPY